MKSVILYVSLLGVGNFSNMDLKESCIEEPREVSRNYLEFMLDSSFLYNLSGIGRPKNLWGIVNRYPKKIGEIRKGNSHGDFIPRYDSRNIGTRTLNKSISRYDNQNSSKKSFQKNRRIDANTVY